MVRFKLIFLLLWTLPAFGWNTPTAMFGTRYTEWTWTGAAGDNNWNNGANWCGAYINGVCKGKTGAPTSTSNVVFNDACSGTNCNVTLPGGTVAVASMQLLSGYTGTITQGATTLNIGAAITANGNLGFIQAGGTFLGGTAPMTLTATSPYQGFFSLSGGTFTSTTDTLSLNRINFSITGGTFNHNSGTVSCNASSGAPVMDTRSAVFYNLRLSGIQGKSITLSSNIYVDGDLSIQSTSAGTWKIRGYKIYVRHGNVYRTGYNVGGTTVIVLRGDGTGTAQQKIDMSSAQAGYPQLPPIAIEQSSVAASVAFVGDISFAGYQASSATNSGTVIPVSGAAYAFANTESNASIFDSDLTTFPGLTIAAVNEDATYGKVIVDGDLKITSSGSAVNASSGTISVTGNVDSTGGNLFGTALTLELKGSGTQTVDVGGSSVSRIPGLKINKTTGAVVLKNSVNGVFDIYGSLNFVPGGIAASALTMPTITDFGIDGSSPTITLNSFEIPATTTFHAKAKGTWVFNENIVLRGNLVIEHTSTSQGDWNGVTTPRTMYVYGNITASAGTLGYQSDGFFTVRLMGSGQKLDFSGGHATSGTRFPPLEVASTGGITEIKTGTIPYLILQNYTYVSGTVDATSSTIQIYNSSITITPGPTEFGGLNLGMNGGYVIASGQTAIVKGNLTLVAKVTTRTLAGNFDVYGNVIAVAPQGTSGTATFNYKGNNSTLDRTVGLPTGLMTVAKNAGQSVSLVTNYVVANQSISVTSGSIDLAGFNMTLSGTGTLTLDAGTTLKLSGGILTIGGSVIPAGAYGAGTIVP